MLTNDHFLPFTRAFRHDDPEAVVNLIPNSHADDWMRQNVPLFTCSDPVIEEIYYFRWWSFRKHLKQTPAGRIITEFIEPVRHAGSYNSISCATSLHFAEGRWLADQSPLDEYARFWFHGSGGEPEPKFHNYSSWVASALLDRAHVTGDFASLVGMLDDLVKDYEIWEQERLLPDGLFWQYDVRDGMEESISGSRTHKNARPTINSYMFANANAIAAIAKLAGRPEVIATFLAKAEKLRQLTLQHLWDDAAGFFKVRFEDGTLSSAREAIGFIPWYFDLPPAGYERAWRELTDPQGFWAPHGLTTAERRHPQGRSHGVGTCEWDGAVWPFATSQTLSALANVLRRYTQSFVRPADYVAAMKVYAASHHMHGKPYIGEYLCESTGEWLKGDIPRSRFYNHSTFADLIISGLIGVVPDAASVLRLHPLLAEQDWSFFCLQNLPYRGRRVSIVWDRDGTRFGRKVGLEILIDGQPLLHQPHLRPVEVPLS